MAVLGQPEADTRRARLTELLRQPVLRKELFTSPVIIESVELLRWENKAFGKSIVPHMSGGGLGFLYNIHLVSVLPNAGAHHEFKGLNTPVQFECKTSPLKVVNGRIKVPTGPGLGVEIDPDFVKKHELMKA